MSPVVVIAHGNVPTCDARSHKKKDSQSDTCTNGKVMVPERNTYDSSGAIFRYDLAYHAYFCGNLMIPAAGKLR